MIATLRQPFCVFMIQRRVCSLSRPFPGPRRDTHGLTREITQWERSSGTVPFTPGCSMRKKYKTSMKIARKQSRFQFLIILKTIIQNLHFIPPNSYHQFNFPRRSRFQNCSAYLLFCTAHVEIRAKIFKLFHLRKIALQLHIEHQDLDFSSVRNPKI